MEKSMPLKTCFVVSPIGDEGSDIRRRADCVLEYIIKPALNELGYAAPIRVDTQDKPAHITTEIINHLTNSDLVIADLSGSNPNVFYELGIRHAIGKACIMLSNWEMSIPFDVGGSNVINYVHDDPSSHARAIARITSQIAALETDPVSNPVTVARGFAELSISGDSEERLIAELSEEIAAARRDIDMLKRHTVVEREPYRGIGFENALASMDPRVRESMKRSLVDKIKMEKLNDYENLNALRNLRKLDTLTESSTEQNDDEQS